MDFWARRKAAVEAEVQEDAAREAQDVAAAEEAAQAEKTDEELLQELGLPEPETLGPEDDFRGFMADGVPQRLKTRALRCLWRSNPVLANVDGLVDYGEDFTDAACVIENMQTAYQVGKGMLAHVEELARQAEAKAAAEAGHDDVADAASNEDSQEGTGDAISAEALADADVTGADAGEPPASEAAEVSTTYWDAGPEDDLAPPPRRRMAFTFDETTA